MKNFFMIATNQVIQIATTEKGNEQHPCSEIIISSMEPEYVLMAPDPDPEKGFQIGKTIKSETFRFTVTKDDLKNIIERLQSELELLERM